MKRTLFSIVLISYITLTPMFSLGQDFKSDKLYPVYGINDYKGNSDCKPSVEVTSINNRLQFIIEVHDDSLQISEDWKNSDHVEIWFNMDADSNDYFVYNKEFYAGRKITDEQRENFRNYLLKQANGNENQINDIKNAELPIVKEINGMAHWAINLKDRTAFLYDREYYIKLPVDTINYLNDKIKITPTIKGKSYKVIIEFDPVALLFLKNLVNKEITFMVDIFDVDGKSNNVSVLSTVQNRKWGAPERFNTVKIKNSIVIEGQKMPTILKRNHHTFYHSNNNSKWNLYMRESIKNNPEDPYYRFNYKLIK